MSDTKRLRSAVWSSETLARGMASISQQPDGLMVKTEEDESMVKEYAVTHLEKILHPFLRLAGNPRFWKGGGDN